MKKLAPRTDGAAIGSRVRRVRGGRLWPLAAARPIEGGRGSWASGGDGRRLLAALDTERDAGVLLAGVGEGGSGVDADNELLARDSEGWENVR